MDNNPWLARFRARVNAVFLPPKRTALSGAPWDTRFRSRARVNPALFLAVPFFNVFLLVAAFGLFSMAYAKRPGIVVELPLGRAEDGMRSSLHLVAKPAPRDDVGGRLVGGRVWHPATTRPPADSAVVTAAMIVFFDDTSYDLRLESEVSALIAAVAAKISVSGETGILLHIDASIPHGDTMALSRMLRGAGAERLCFVIAVQPEMDGE